MLWEGLSTIICCHLDINFGPQRKKFLTYMLDSLNNGSMLPEKTIISITSCIPIKDIETNISNYKFEIKLINRGDEQISQMIHLHKTLVEEKDSLKYIVLLDDDDLVSPYLIKEHHDIWCKFNKPKLFCFISGLTQGHYTEHDSYTDKFDLSWKLEYIRGEMYKTEYGGTLYSLPVLLYYMNLIKQENLEQAYGDLFLKCYSVEHSGVYGEGCLMSQVITEPDISGFINSEKIYKHSIPKPLYFHRFWRLLYNSS